MEITVDEWLIHYISEPERRNEVFTFLQTVKEKCDSFVTIRGGNLERKIWRMSKASGYWSPDGRALVKWFMFEFRKNSSRFHLVEQAEVVTISSELENKTPSKDLYLVKCAMTTGSIIVTTDNRLRECLSDVGELTISSVDEFISQYDC